MAHTYQLVGEQYGPFGVTEDGVMLYDLIESRSEAEIIRDVCDEGLGPEWDAIEDEVVRRLRAR
jgi:hypothetical protein